MSNWQKFALLIFLDAFLILMLLFVALPSVVVPPEALWQPGSISLPSAATECITGEKAECVNFQNCTGYRACREGKWSECIIKKMCTPGDTTGCFVDLCKTGYAVCNRCGTAYENCS